MAVTDRKIRKDAKTAIKHVPVPLVTVAASQTNKEFARVRPGYKFEVVGVETYAEADTNVTDVRVLIDTKVVLSANVAVTGGSRVAGTLSATLANRRGTATEDIILQYTSGATPTITNGMVHLMLRPRPLNAEAE